MTDRNPPVAQAQMRAAIDRALAAGLTLRQWRVFAAILQIVPLFDRLEDRVPNAQIVARTGLDKAHVRRALRDLHDLGVIHRTPGSSRAGGTREASLISLVAHPGTGGRGGPGSTGRPEADPAPGRPGADSTRDRGPNPTQTGGRPRPTSESLPEIDPSEGVAPPFEGWAEGLDLVRRSVPAVARRRPTRG